MLTIERQTQIVLRVKECLAQASQRLQRNFPLPHVTFNQRGKIAGCARLQANELRFNRILLNDNYQLFMDEVVPHEVCHLITYQLYGRVKPHGAQWQRLMAVLFDLKGATRHAMDVSKVQGKSFEYMCQCGPVTLTIRRHNKVLANKQRYICRRCKQILVAA
ncbi:MAG: SprT protein [Paraglaciecola sp.]|jgi:SprT protein